MINFKLVRAFSLILLFAFVLAGCSAIKQVTQTLVNLQRLKFKLENVNGFRLAGISISDKKSISDFSLTDGINLSKAFTSKSLPAQFVLNVAAINPNDGTGGSKQTTATLTSFDWQLYIDDVPTVSGNIDKPIEIPGTGQQSIIPLSISLDLVKFFENKGYEGIVNLALAIGGVNSSPARLKLDAKPTVSTPFGAISSPRITIVDKQFN
ncbi:MAG: hypothetical protein N2319_07890 [Candidatus Kapabacteria bacterium]|nr:hypothetical protein [Candidatus Kapabacteria bacterium]